MNKQSDQVEELEAKLERTTLELERVRGLLDDFEEERMQLLTVRDYAIGMEMSYGQAQFELEQKDILIAELRAEILRSTPLTRRVLRKAKRAAQRAISR